MTAKKNDAAKVTIKLYSHAELPKKIDAWGKAGLKHQTEGHRLACSALHHLYESKDIRVTMMFINSAPEMVRTNGLRAWFEAFGPIKFIDAEGNDDAPRAVFVKDKPVRLGDAMAKPFWKFNANEGQPYKALDVDKFTNQAIARLVKDAKETGADHSALIMALKGVASVKAAPKADPVMTPEEKIEIAKLLIDPITKLPVQPTA